MNAMTCKLSGLFSIGEDFDDEDLLGTDWTPSSGSGPAKVAAAVSSCALRASSVAHREPENIRHQQTKEKLAAMCNGTASGSAQTVALGLRQLSSSSPLPTPNNSQPNLAPQQSHANTKGLMNSCVALDDFDDWDVDLADLDECDSQIGQPQKSAASAPPASAAEPPSSAKTLRPSAYGGSHSVPNQTFGELRTACNTSSTSGYNSTLRSPFVAHLQSLNPRPALTTCPQTSTGFPNISATSPALSSFSGTLNSPQQPHKQWVTPQASAQARRPFETVSSAASPSENTSTMSPHPLHTPVLTNRLVQLVSASNKLPRKRPRSEAHQPRTRRFPGPAGLLPQQPQVQNLDEIVVSVPQTPAHGAVARLPSQGSSSQTEEEEFSGGAWAAMKAEMGLDERNPACFLHTYSVVMVLRRAALKQLPRNKVPNMAVLLRSIVHTNTDAKAVFKDPTDYDVTESQVELRLESNCGREVNIQESLRRWRSGGLLASRPHLSLQWEIQGTVHRRLLEERADELKAGAVLLLKQVGVFSPSHRNHYLNVTPNNLLRIYAPDGVSLLSTPLPPLLLEPMMSSPAWEPSVLRGPVSVMQLEFDEEDEEGDKRRGCTKRAEVPQEQTHTEENKSVRSSRAPTKSAENPAPQDPDWDADDNLDELLGELPEDTYSF